MRFAKYILMFVAFAVATACTMTDVDEVVVAPVQSQGVQIVSRILPFADYDVSTRAAKNSKETEAKTLDFVILGASGKCIFYKHTNGDTTISIDKEADFDGISTDEYEECGIYVLVNYPALYDKIVGDALEAGANSTDEYVAKNIIGKVDGYYFIGATPVEATSQIPSSGLPMYGSKTDVDLSTFANGEAVTVPVQSLYSKVVFDITVNPTQTLPKTPVFKLNGYTINNLAATVDILAGTESVRVEDDTTPKVTVVTKTTGSSDSVDVHDAVEGDLTGVDTKADQEVSFSFYLPERYLQIGNVDEFVYPFGPGADIRQEDARYRQRYKPLLAQGYTNYEANQQTRVADPRATYVTFYGVYTNHQGHSYDVSYDIYVGNDNYSNFDIVRNRQYNNSVILRGIDTSHNNNSTELYAVSIDHRVNVTRTQPVIINLRRETLLDSHIEVRPMRIRKNSNYTSGAKYVKVEVDKQWVRLERSFGNTEAKTLDSDATRSESYIVSNNSSNGKRKYFTTDLVTSTTGGNSVVVPIDASNQTVWIYVDENLDNPGDGVRSATLTVTSYKDENCTQRVQVDGNDLEPIVYTLNQHNLFKVESSKTHYIEYEEEYLYNFDAEDAFLDENGKPTTQYEGMPWGLDGVQLSNEHSSFSLNEDNDDWEEFVSNTLLPTYDFYLQSQDEKALQGGGVSHSFAGQHFTADIYTKSNGEVKVLTMEDQASGAVEYCYNRNKRNRDGSVAAVEWYLPSADELEDFIVPAYSTFGEFQNNYYWTSQPAYIKNIFYYEYSTGVLFWKETTTSATPMYIDNINYARATKVKYLGNEQFDAAKSGLNTEPEDFTPRTESGYNNLGCFYEMPRWKNGTYDIATKSTADNNSNPPKVIGSRNGDERYTDTRNGDKKYYVHLGHLDDLMQEGYHPRTRNNRVRCVRVAPSN